MFQDVVQRANSVKKAAHGRTHTVSPSAATVDPVTFIKPDFHSFVVAHPGLTVKLVVCHICPSVLMYSIVDLWPQYSIEEEQGATVFFDKL